MDKLDCQAVLLNLLLFREHHLFDLIFLMLRNRRQIDIGGLSWHDKKMISGDTIPQQDGRSLPSICCPSEHILTTPAVGLILPWIIIPFLVEPLLQTSGST